MNATRPEKLRFALYSSSLGNYFFNEIRELIGAGLEELGHGVELRNEEAGFDKRADWHLVIAPHEFYQLGTGEALAARPSPPNLILFNTEQPSTQWFRLAAKHFPRAAAIWDIDYESALRITQQGCPCHFLPLGYTARASMFQEVAQLPQHEGTRQVPAEIAARSCFKQPLANRPYDLLFLGHASARRQEFFKKNAAALARYRQFFHHSNVARPLIPGQTTPMNTATSAGLAQRSKILLNIHHGLDIYFEWHRIVLLGIAQRALVLTETCNLAPPFRANLDFVEAPLEEIPERIQYYLESAQGKREAQDIVDRAFETLTQQCRIRDFLQPLVARLEDSSAPEPLVRLPAPVASGPAPAIVRANRPQFICVVTHDVALEGRHAESGGAQLALAENLAVAGHKVTLLHTHDSYGLGRSIGWWTQHFLAKGIRYVALPAELSMPVEAPPALLRAHKTYRWLQNQGFNIVHFPDSEGIGFYSLLAKRQGFAFATTRLLVRGYSPGQWWREGRQEFLQQVSELEINFMERECARLADAFTVPTQYMLQWLKEQSWVLPKAMDVVPDAPAPAPGPVAEGRRQIRELIFLGPLETAGGLSLFCDALDLLDEHKLKRVRVTFMGSALVVNGLKNDVYLRRRSAGWACACGIDSKAEPDAIWDRARGEGTLAVFAAAPGNSPCAVRRCLDWGIPFLACNSGGTAELIHAEDRERALFPNSARGLAAALKKVLEEGAQPVQPAREASSLQAEWLRYHETLATVSDAAADVPSPGHLSSVSTPPLVSVCLVHYNRPGYLRQAIASIEAQDYPHYEVILVDDGSTQPEAIQYLTQLEPVFRKRGWQIVRQENRYLGAARNAAARHARGDYLLFMDDDNYAKPEEISTFVRVALRTGADVLTASMDLFSGPNPPNPKLPPRARWVFLGGAITVGAFRNCFGDANALIRREVFWNLGGFSEDYGVTHEDWEFHARAALQGVRMETIPEALFWYRYSPGSMIHTTPNYANHCRSLRPYLAAAPALRELVAFMQGQKFRVDELHELEGAHQFARRLLKLSLTTGKALAVAGQADLADSVFLHALKCTERIQTHELKLETLIWTGKTLGELGRVKEAGTLLDRALALARRIKHAPATDLAQALLDAIRTGADLDAACGGMDLSDETDLEPARPRKRALAPNGGSSSSDTKFLAREASALPPPPVTLIIPVFNKIEFTRKCLEALRRNTCAESCELVMIDNGSEDGTLDYLRSEESSGHLRLIHNTRNLGFAAACNQGARAARGRYLLFLNNDTEVQPDWFEPLIALADADPAVAAVGSKLLFPDGKIQHAGVVLGAVPGRDPLLAVHVHYKADGDLPAANQRRIYSALTAACVLVRKSAFDAAGGFDEQFWNGYEDIDLCLRLRQTGGLLVYEPSSVVLHHESQSGPARFEKAQQNIRRLHEKWLAHVKPDVILNADGTVAPGSSFRIRPYELPAKRLPLTSIIILAHNQLEHTRRCLESIQANTPEPHELILVDNASMDGTREYFRELASNQPDVRVVLNSTNRGFAAGNNQALAIARGDCTLLLNNDTVVAAGWLSRMLSVLQRKLGVGIVGPMSNAAVGPQLVADVPCALPGELSRFAAGWAARFAGQTIEANRVIGFCLLARRAVLDRIGGLDEQFGTGNFEDDDFCIRARLAGFQVCIAKDVFIHHAGNQTFRAAGIDYRQAMLTNWGLFKRKWGIPAETPPHAGYMTPKSLPAGVSLKFDLKDLKNSHQPSEDGRIWMDPSAGAVAAAVSSRPTGIGRRAAPTPACARLGDLGPARRALGQNKPEEAWKLACAAIQQRPFHPEAFLLLAQIALTSGDGLSARECARHARRLAPGWNAPKTFLQKPLKGNSRPEWLIPPQAVAREENPKAANVQQPGHTSRLMHSTSRLTVCVITKNEERFLDLCLGSVKGLANQIVVVDTGSTDRTVEIARSHGAEVHVFEWCDDFSAARNAALEHARGDWVLMLDADEELPPDQHELLRNDLKNPKVIAYRLPLANAGVAADEPQPVPRLFRNAPGAFFRNRIHEQVFPSLLALSKPWGLGTELGAARLLHHGYGEDVVKDRSKVERNLRLLRMAVQESPEDANLAMNFGLELVRSGDPTTGLNQYREAFRLLSAQSSDAVSPELREALLTQLTCQLYRQQQHGETVRVLTSPLALNGGLTASLHFSLGLSYFALNQHREAAEHLRLCLAKRDKPTLSPVTADIRAAAPHHCLALCLARLGDAVGADKAFQSALAQEGRSDDIKLDYARFLLTQDRPIEALHCLHEAVALDSGNVRAWRLGGEIALSRPDFLDFASDWTGEALQHSPEDPAIVAQRAETLMLRQDIDSARSLWEKACNGSRPPRALAAWILCSAAAAQSIPATRDAAEEAATSRAFVQWYQRLVTFGARQTVQRLNSRRDALRPSLPTAAQLLDSALA